MRHLILFTITVLITTITTSGQNALDNLVSKNDTTGLKAFVKKSDIHFTSDWALNKVMIEDIDHFEKGYVLAWEKSTNKITHFRTYVFGLNSQFVRAYEQRFANDTLLSQGPVEFKNKSILYITQVIINKKSLKKENSYWNYEVDGYLYEIYENGKLSCVYKTTYLNHYSMLFEKANKDKVELVTGKDCLGIKNE